jgi:hypothetical protein
MIDGNGHNKLQIIRFCGNKLYNKSQITTLIIITPLIILLLHLCQQHLLASICGTIEWHI